MADWRTIDDEAPKDGRVLPKTMREILEEQFKRKYRVTPRLKRQPLPAPPDV